MGHGMGRVACIMEEKGLLLSARNPVLPLKRRMKFTTDPTLWKKTADIIESGRLLFQLDAQPTCTMCHGRNGDGTGMMGGSMVPPPRNFTCGETMNAIPDGQIFWIIKNGSPGTGMPAFSGLKDEQVWQLVHYLRSLVK